MVSLARPKHATHEAVLDISFSDCNLCLSVSWVKILGYNIQLINSSFAFIMGWEWGVLYEKELAPPAPEDLLPPSDLLGHLHM